MCLDVVAPPKTAVMCLLVVWFSAGCSEDTGQMPDTGQQVSDASAGDVYGDAAHDAATNPGRCVDLKTRELCADTGCTQTACADDEVCQNGGCQGLADADLSADFALTYHDANPYVITVDVDDGGFRRDQVDALRFGFGDHIAGWNEHVDHRYDSPGVFPVDLTVRLTGGRILRASKLAVIAADDSAAINPLFLSVNDIPAYLNGSQPAPLDAGTPQNPADDTTAAFTLQVVRDHFDIDVALRATPDNPVVRDSLSLTADVTLGEVAAGDELAGHLVFEDADSLDAPRAHLAVDADMAPPVGPVEFQLSARTDDGQSHRQTLRVEAVDLPAARDPFDRPMVWLFRDDTDFFSTAADTPDTTTFNLPTTRGANGEPDFAEELHVIGAQGPDDQLNAAFMGWIHAAIAKEIYRYFGIDAHGQPHDGIELTIAWQGDAGAPDPADFDPDGDVSIMRFGGFFDGFLGFSQISLYNEERVDDSTVDYGIGTASLLAVITSTPLVSAIEPIRPGVGEPVGANTYDAQILADTFDAARADDPAAVERYRTLRRMAYYIALIVAPVTAHEMGHAMGLVPDGLPPQGYFGARSDVSFVSAARTNSHHVDFPGLNLMQAGGDYLALFNKLNRYTELPGADFIRTAEVLSLEDRLSPLSRAYLQGRLTYGASVGGQQ